MPCAVSSCRARINSDKSSWTRAPSPRPAELGPSGLAVPGGGVAGGSRFGAADGGALGELAPPGARLLGGGGRWLSLGVVLGLGRNGGGLGRNGGGGGPGIECETDGELRSGGGGGVRGGGGATSPFSPLFGRGGRVAGRGAGPHGRAKTSGGEATLVAEVSLSLGFRGSSPIRSPESVRPSIAQIALGLGSAPEPGLASGLTLLNPSPPLIFTLRAQIAS